MLLVSESTQVASGIQVVLSTQDTAALQPGVGHTVMAMAVVDRRFVGIVDELTSQNGCIFRDTSLFRDGPIYVS